MSSAAQRMIHLYGIKPGTEAVILTGNNDGYGTALDLHDAGIKVQAIIDLRDTPIYDDIAEEAISRGIPVKTGFAVYAAHNKGAVNVTSVEVRKIVDQGICADIG